MTKSLSVYLNKILVGTFQQDDSGRESFLYDKKYLNSKSAIPISCSMPLRAEAFDDKTTRAFFSGFLPDEIQRTILAKNLGSSEKNPFSLLEEVGRECAGALQILPQSSKPEDLEQKPNLVLKESDVKQRIADLPRDPLLAKSGKIRISLAGAQSKFVVFFDEKRKSNLQQTQSSERPSTHIVKPKIRGFFDSAHNEFFCMKLAKEIGLDVSEVFLRFAEEEPYLLVRRYDRKIDSKGNVSRIHQEDFCQAMSIPPELKYQSEGGPSIKTCLELIKTHSSQPGLDSAKFSQAVIFNFMIGNCDAHGKNFSLVYDKGRTKLAPLYDLMSTSIYGNHARKMAMKIGKSSDPGRTSLLHWNQIVPNTALARDVLAKELKNFATKLPLVAEELEKKLAKKKIQSEVFAQIRALINQNSARVLRYFK